MSSDVPWVADEAAREADERRMAGLVGRRIARTRYVELDCAGLGGTPEPA